MIDREHADIRDKAEEIIGIYNSIAIPNKDVVGKPQKEVLPKLSDDEVLSLARKGANEDGFKKLWDGDISGYPSQSEADLALVGKLARLTRGNAEQVDRLFRQSGLMRLKWDEKHHADGRTYGEGTVQTAIASCTYFYSPPLVTSEEIMKALEDGEQGDASMFITLHRNQLCFDHAAQLWYLWGKHYWTEDITNVALASVMNVVNIYEKERDRLKKQQYGNDANPQMK